MRFAFDEEQEQLRAQARAFLADHASSEQVREAMASDPGYDPGVWKRVGAELGWPAIAIPEAHGGLGLGAVELVALLEETGRALFCSPLFATVCLGANALQVAGSEAQQAQWLPRIASGEVRASLAFESPGGSAGSGSAAAGGVRVSRDGDGFRLRGTRTLVLDGHTAELLVVEARQEGAPGGAGPSLLLVPGDAPGLSRRALPTLDATRRQGELRFDDVALPGEALLGSFGGAGAPLQEVLDRAAVALAAEQVGGAQACLDMAVAYARERVQFGRPIGSFQAVKHRCADLLLRVESARSAAYHAGWVADHEPAGLALAASTAKAYCSDAYWRCASENLQIHGGVGFTWEYDVHLHLKRARAGEAFLGTPALHRERVARVLGLGS